MPIARPKIYEPPGTLASAEWAGLAAAVAAALAEGPRPRAVAIIGSRPGPDDGTLATIVASCRDAGVPVYLDGHGPAVLDALRAQPTVIKVNLEEARSLLAAEVDADAAAARIAAMGQGIAIVTVGADGAVCFDGERLRRIPGPTRPGPFPGGSGDAFLAGLIAAHVAGQTLDAALDQARRCAAANATSPYAGWAPPDTAPIERG